MTTSALDRSDTDGVERDGPSTGAVGAGRGFALLLVITGAMGLLASWVITLDKFKLLEDPNFVPGCSLNPIVSCGNIMSSEQAKAFGFPNPMLGLVAYGVIIAVGMGLLAGARYRRWYWLGMEAGCLFGVGFVTWLQYQSLYVIGSLCLWCCLAWVATIVMFWYVTVQNLRHGFIPAPEGLKRGILEFHWVVPVLWIGVIGMLILTKWWWFWTGGTA
ncbi:vitamin K epoxide reductase family protein [Streptomyces cinnamoneus]|uniref:Membrane protein n=1 Tax=Streptomyces cinnamoneus TaxID=53446 RepID=A0A918THQ0_STRCJ|nr:MULTISPECIES: vitamin K epoxide reductase family protein [Streptomyces]MCA6093091.1 vitamin K epoxide reductase family protein [Streptomyces sichuanensis]GHC42624.1 membrane protein [Streptomyces cinnamoneus]